MQTRQLKSSLASRVAETKMAAAFTLIEMLIAIAILGVGMAMAAALLPAGMVANENSSKDLTGTLICQNGLAIAKARLTHSDSPTNSDTLEEITDTFTDDEKKDTYYPTIAADVEIDDAKPTSGFLLLGRRVVSGENIYQLVAISYSLSYDQDDNPSSAKLDKVGGSVDVDDKTVTFTGNTNKVRIGSPVVVADSSEAGDIGAFARILKLEDNVATLDVPLPEDSTHFWVIYEEKDAGINVLHPRSCGLTALGMITPLN